MTDAVTPVSNTGAMPDKQPKKDTSTKSDNKGVSSGATSTTTEAETEYGDQPLTDGNLGSKVHTKA